MDAHERLRAAHRAIGEGQYAEALDGLVWFHHRALEYDRHLGAVRLSYGLVFWLDLARVYPPALDALLELRERKAQALVRGEGDVDLFHDLVAIDKVMEQPGATHACYVSLLEQQPGLAADCTGLALPAIVAAGDYALADRVRPDPETRLREMAALMRLEAKWNKRRRYTRWSLPASMLDHRAGQVRRDAEISATVGRRQEAQRLLALAVDLIQDPVMRRAMRAKIARQPGVDAGEAKAHHRRAKARRREARHLHRA